MKEFFYSRCCHISLSLSLPLQAMAPPSSVLVLGSAFLCVLFLLTVFPQGAWSQTNPASSSTQVSQNFTCPNGTLFTRPEVCPSKVGKTLYVLVS